MCLLDIGLVVVPCLSLAAVFLNQKELKLCVVKTMTTSVWCKKSCFVVMSCTVCCKLAVSMTLEGFIVKLLYILYMYLLCEAL